MQANNAPFRAFINRINAQRLIGPGATFDHNVDVPRSVKRAVSWLPIASAAAITEWVGPDAVFSLGRADIGGDIVEKVLVMRTLRIQLL